MDRFSVEFAFSLSPPITAGGTFEWNSSSTEVIYRPLTPLNFFTTYEAKIAAGAVDMIGNSLLNVPVIFRFTTIPSDATPPSIGNVRFNNRPYIAGDIISRTPLVTSVITDEAEGSGVDPGTGASGIIIRFGAYTVATVDSYSKDTGAMSCQVKSGSPLAPGIYPVSIEASDVSGNRTSWSGTVRISGGTTKLLGVPMTYPSVFKPLSGQKLGLSYILSADTDITLYVYGISGNVVLTRKFEGGMMGGRAGYNYFEWNGATDFGFTVGNGIYLYRITSGREQLGKGKIVVYD